MKKSISFLLIATILLTLCPLVLGADNSNYAIVLSGDLRADNNTTINGSVYSANGNVSIGTNGSNVVNGNVVVNKNNNISGLTGDNVVKLDKTSFKEEPKKLEISPLLTGTYHINDESQIVSSGSNTHLLLANARYDFIEIAYQTGIANVSKDGNCYIDVASFSMRDNTSLYFFETATSSSEGNTYIMAKDFLLGNDCSINQSSSVPNFAIEVSGKFSVGKNSLINSDMYLSGVCNKINGNASITGNIFSDTKTLEISNGATINGVIYAPNTDVKIFGNCKMNGRIVAKSLDISDNSTVTYDGNYAANQKLKDAPKVQPLKQTQKQDDAKKADSKSDEKSDRNTIKIEISDAYLLGNESKKVNADSQIKREEANALIFRLLKQDNKIADFVAPTGQTYTDVNPQRWSFSAIEYMTSIGIYDKESKKFSPEEFINRGEAAKILSYALNIKQDESKPNSVDNFSDLPLTNPYYNYIKALFDADVLKGYSDNTIKPDGKITRAEFITMINRIIGRDYDVSDVNSPYSDLDSSHWAYKELMRASFKFKKDENGKYIIDKVQK